MLVAASRPVLAKPFGVVWAVLSLVAINVTVFTLIIGAVSCDVESANIYFVGVVFMQELTRLTLLAHVLHPMLTHLGLSLALVDNRARANEFHGMVRRELVHYFQ